MRSLAAALAASALAAALGCATPPRPEPPPVGGYVALFPADPSGLGGPASARVGPGRSSIESTPSAPLISGLESQLAFCLARDERRVLRPEALRRIQRRMAAEIAAEQGRSVDELDETAWSAIEGAAEREFLDDHPEVTTVVRTTFVEALAQYSGGNAFWDGVMRPLGGTKLGFLARLHAPSSVDALSMRIRIETRTGEPLWTATRGVGLLAHGSHEQKIELLAEGEVDTDPDSLELSVRSALAPLCGEAGYVWLGAPAASPAGKDIFKRVLVSVLYLTLRTIHHPPSPPPE